MKFFDVHKRIIDVFKFFQSLNTLQNARMKTYLHLLKHISNFNPCMWHSSVHWMDSMQTDAIVLTIEFSLFISLFLCSNIFFADELPHSCQLPRFLNWGLLKPDVSCKAPWVCPTLLRLNAVSGLSSTVENTRHTLLCQAPAGSWRPPGWKALMGERIKRVGREIVHGDWEITVKIKREKMTATNNRHLMKDNRDTRPPLKRLFHFYSFLSSYLQGDYSILHKLLKTRVIIGLEELEKWNWHSFMK